MAADKEKPILNVVAKPATAAPKKQSRKALAVAFNRVLKREKIVPLQMLIRDVLPLLEPPKQADVLLKLIEYQYPKVGQEPQSKKIQVNTQINNGPAQAATEPPKELPSTPRPALAASNIAEMMRIAAGIEAEKQK